MIRSLTTTIILALVAFVNYAEASACKASNDNICLDGTNATPCCGYGKCNVFCYNCNGGCRRLTYEGCILASASAYYQCSTGSGSVYDFGICQTAKDAADQACRNQFPGHTTRSTSQQLDAICDGNHTTRMSNTIFDFADSDGTGNLTLPEYFTIMGLSMGDSGPEIAQRSMWAKYFISFDANEDGVLTLDEHHTATTDGAAEKVC